MANWDKPLGVYRNPAQQHIDREAPGLRERLEARSLMISWPYNDKVQPGYPPDDVQLYCVKNISWQRVRLSMKGVPTHEKLRILKEWWDSNENSQKGYITEVQVGNYLGALRRGGQLDYANRVRRYI